MTSAHVTIKINGLRATKEKLAKFPERVESEVVMKALQEGSDLGLRKIQALAPVKTGKVRKGFRASPSLVLKKAPLYGYYIYLSGGKLGRENPRHNFYARWVEYGHLAGVRSKVIVKRSALDEKLNQPGTKVRVFNKNSRVVSRERSDRPGQMRRRRVGWKHVPGQYFVHRAFRATAESSARQIAWASERGINKIINEMERD